MRVAIIGAGLAGLIAGRELFRGGADVIVFDKGRSPGGRLATRRIGGATLDHGAQFFTVRSPAFAAQVADWESVASSKSGTMVSTAATGTPATSPQTA